MLSPRGETHHREDVNAWKELPGIVKVVPEIKLPGSVALELEMEWHQHSVRMGGGDFDARRSLSRNCRSPSRVRWTCLKRAELF